jgi:hypothetical protein
MVAHHLPGHFFIPTRRVTSPGSVLRRCCGYAAALAITALVVFHASILYNHVVDGRLGDPGVAFRWAIGGLLAGLLVAFHRMGVPLVHGRRALVVWVLVALLHVSAARTVTLPLLDVAPEDAAAVLVIVPAAAPILLGTLLLLAFVLGCATLAAPDLRRAWLAHDADARVAAGPPVPRLAPRAPPCRHQI